VTKSPKTKKLLQYLGYRGGSPTAVQA